MNDNDLQINNLDLTNNWSDWFSSLSELFVRLMSLFKQFIKRIMLFVLELDKDNTKMTYCLALFLQPDFLIIQYRQQAHSLG